MDFIIIIIIIIIKTAILMTAAGISLNLKLQISCQQNVQRSTVDCLKKKTLLEVKVVRSNLL